MPIPDVAVRLPSPSEDGMRKELTRAQAEFLRVQGLTVRNTFLDGPPEQEKEASKRGRSAPPSPSRGDELESLTSGSDSVERACPKFLEEHQPHSGGQRRLSGTSTALDEQVRMWKRTRRGGLGKKRGGWGGVRRCLEAGPAARVAVVVAEPAAHADHTGWTFAPPAVPPGAAQRGAAAATMAAPVCPTLPPRSQEEHQQPQQPQECQQRK